ncbi:MAG: hypothetical protein K0S61_4072, partial [Anaerocolumna sp.]|nr:hypothetical protein [Anaerocolumna sp.]
LSGVKYLDYLREKSITKPHYQISFDNTKAMKYYNFLYIEINSSNEAIAYFITYRDFTIYNPFVSYAKQRYYPIDLSPKSLKIIFNYITAYQNSASKGESQ